jgi:hypothetical protein
LFFLLLTRNSPEKSKGAIVNNNALQWPGNFACKDKDVRRDRPQITMTINAVTMTGLPTAGAALWPPCRGDAVADRLQRGRPRWAPLGPLNQDDNQENQDRLTLREFQFRE